MIDIVDEQERVGGRLVRAGGALQAGDSSFIEASKKSKMHKVRRRDGEGSGFRQQAAPGSRRTGRVTAAVAPAPPAEPDVAEPAPAVEEPDAGAPAPSAGPGNAQLAHGTAVASP